jgi:adenosylmethionine-8-amino-7-oxononanoate aminotransferase
VNGHTYSAHAIACAAALAVQRVIHDEGLLDCVRVRGQYLQAGLEEPLRQHRCVGDIRGRGLLPYSVTEAELDIIIDRLALAVDGAVGA